MIASQVQMEFGVLKLSKGRTKTTVLAELLQYAPGMSQQELCRALMEGCFGQLGQLDQSLA